MEKILIGILIGVVCVFIGYAIFTILYYRRQKVQWLHVIDQYRQAFQDQPTLNIHERMIATESLFKLIDSLIQHSIISDQEYSILLQKQSKNLDVEDALERISTAVFKWLNPTIYTDINSAVTEECIMTYIQKRTFIEYFMYLKNSAENEGGA